MKRSLIAALTVAGIAGSMATAEATTTAFAFTVPLTVTGATPGRLSGSTVTCAVGGGTLGYRSGSPTADNSWGQGATTIAPGGITPDRVTISFTADVPTPTDAATGLQTGKTPATKYVCWITPSAAAANRQDPTGKQLPAFPLAFVQGDVPAPR